MNNTKQCCCIEFLENDSNLKLAISNETYSIYGNLNKGEKVIIKYFGTLITDNETDDTKIFLNYGYGNLWDEKNVSEMKLCNHCDSGCYCASLELINAENLFFCFMDNNNKWDLDKNSSYMITIDTPIKILTKKTVSVIIPDEEYMSITNKLFQKLTSKLINLFAKIGSLFDNKIKA